MRSLETTSGDFYRLPSLAHSNFWETNAGEFPEVTATAGGCSDCRKLRRLLEAAATVGSCGDCWKLHRLLEAAVTVGSCGDCWKLRRLFEAEATVWRCGDCWKLQRLTGEACNMMENALSILIAIFSVQLQQTETSDRKLFIFLHGKREEILMPHEDQPD